MRPVDMADLTQAQYNACNDRIRAINDANKT